MTFEETNQLQCRLITFWGFIEKIGLKWIGLTLVTIVPLLILEKNVSSKNQIIIVIVEQLVVVLAIFFWNKKDPEILYNKTLKKEIDFTDVEVVNIKSYRVFKRKDPEDFGTGYYFDLGKQTIYLQGQYLDLLNHSSKFPNSDFEIIRTKREKILIDYKTKGEYLKPEKTLKSFTNEQYKSGDFHNDGQIIDLNIEEIK